MNFIHACDFHLKNLNIYFILHITRDDSCICMERDIMAYEIIEKKQYKFRFKQKILMSEEINYESLYSLFPKWFTDPQTN